MTAGVEQSTLDDMAIEWRQALELVQPGSVVASVEDIPHNRWLTPGIWAVSSNGQRMVLKCLTADREPSVSRWDAHWTEGAHEPRHWNYWAREGLAYQHQLVDVYEPGGIVGPALLAAHSTDDLIVLLLEHVEGLPGEQWGPADYATASKSLGKAHGRLLGGHALSEYCWLSHGFLRQYSSEKPADWSLLDSDEAWHRPAVERNFPPELREAAAWLHAARDRLYEISAALPRVLCHLDFWTKNLVLRPDGSIVLIDWAFVGDGAIGEDVGNLIPDAAFDHFVDAEALPALEAMVRGAYLEGLANAGWKGDPRLAELGLCASAVKYDWLTPAMLLSASASRQMRYGGTEEIDADFRFRQRGIALLDNAERARRAVTLAHDLAL
jgi:hypothetical protein